MEPLVLFLFVNDNFSLKQFLKSQSFNLLGWVLHKNFIGGLPYGERANDGKDFESDRAEHVVKRDTQDDENQSYRELPPLLNGIQFAFTLILVYLGEQVMSSAWFSFCRSI